MAIKIFDINSKALRRHSLNFKILLKKPLFKSSFIMFLNTAINSAFGFIFWILAARLYRTDDVGLASVLISAGAIIATLSSFGFPSSIVRFMPESNKRNELFNSTYLISLAISFILGILFIAGSDIISPSLQLLDKPEKAVIFLILIFFQISNTFIYYTLLSIHKAEYSFVQNLGGFIKIILLPIFIFLGITGILGSSALAYLGSVSIGSHMLSKSGIEIGLKFSGKVLEKMFKFSFANYLIEILVIIQMSGLPIIALNRVGPNDAGYFFVAFSIATLLFAISSSVFYSMFIEGSHGVPVKKLAISSLKLALAILIPCAFVLYLVGDILLKLFGQAYSENSYEVLKILIISSPFAAINDMFIAVKRIEKDNRLLMIMILMLFSLIIYLSYTLAGQMGLVGIGLGWTLGHAITAILAGLFLLRDYLKTI